MVEGGYFEEITIGFLLVGHTHASIDQYFSCLRHRIREAMFIASPLALQYLFSLLNSATSSRNKSKKSSIYRPPLAQVQIVIVRDYKSAFAPYCNPLITKYGVPYNFRLNIVAGKCCLQYKQYDDEKLPWLPIAPLRPIQSLDQMFQCQISDIQDNLSLETDQGSERLLAHYKVPSSLLSNTLIRETSILDSITDMNFMLPLLIRNQKKAAVEQEKRHADEANGVDDVERYTNNDQHSIQRSLQSVNTVESGS